MNESGLQSLVDHETMAERVDSERVPEWVRAHFTSFTSGLTGERNGTPCPCFFGTEAVRNGEAGDETLVDPEPEPEPESAEPEGTRVEYVNYDALDDHGWSLDDPELFETVSDAGLDPVDYGRLLVEPRESLLEGAENRGFTWPYACRGGACANCAVAVVEGELDQPPNHVLSQELLDRGIRLSCVGVPTTDDLKVVYNVKHLPDLDELLLPAKRFGQVSPSE